MMPLLTAGRRAAAARREAPWAAAAVLFILFYTTLVLRTAWVDALPRSTAAPPAWALLLSVARALAGDPYAATIAASVTLSFVSVALIASAIAVDGAAALVALAIVTSSRAFVEYSTSGYSSPLVYICLAGFWSVWWLGSGRRSHSTVLLTIASVSVLTDWTAGLLLAPALIAYGLPRSWRGVAVGLSPLGASALYAIVTTAARPGSVAVLSPWRTFGGAAPMVAQGLRYLLDTIDHDPLTILAVVSGGCLALRARPLRPLGAGLALYLIVVLAWGGDAMSGRLFAPAVFCAAVAIARTDFERVGAAILAPIGIALGLGLITPAGPLRADPAEYARTPEPLSVPWPGARATVSPGRAVIRDERRLSYPATGLMTWQRDAPLPRRANGEHQDSGGAESPPMVAPTPRSK